MEEEGAEDYITCGASPCSKCKRTLPRGTRWYANDETEDYDICEECHEG